MARSSKADIATYEMWVRAYHEELFRFAYRMSGDREIARDLVQETYYEAWKGIGSLRKLDAARAWLYQILRNRCARWMRAEAQSGLTQRLPSDASVQLAGDDRSLMRETHRDSLQFGLNALSDRLKVPLLMVFMEGATCQEVSERLDIPLGTVLSRIHRAKQQVRATLERAETSPRVRHQAHLDKRAADARNSTFGEAS